MLPPSSDSAALVPTCPCPSALCIAPSTSQGQGDPHNQDPKGGAVLTSHQLSQRGAGPHGSEQGPPSEAPNSETGRGTAPGRWEQGTAPESADILSLGWTTLESGGKLPAMRAVVCGGSPLPVSAVHREVLPLWAIVFHEWTWGLQMFCGHFHAEPTQILTGEVRVDKPSGPRPRLPLPGCSCRRPHLPGCLPGCQQPGLVKGSGVVQSSRPRSRVSWCSEKILPPLSFTL